jgi:hypothetical protein
VSKPPHGIEGKPNPNPDDAHGKNDQCRISGDVNVSGKVETQFPPNLVEEYKTSSGKNDRREDKRFIVEIVTLGFVILLGILGLIQSCQAIKSANGVVTANQIAKDNFRTDQRPYLIRGVSSTPATLEIVADGPHAGQLRFGIPFENYGKSPAIVTGQNIHIAVGKDEVLGISFDQGSFTSTGIFPAGDKPIFFAYSEKLTPEQDAIIRPNIATMAVPIPVVVYGHIDYTDIFPAPNPEYITAFCGPFTRSPDYSPPYTCETHNYIK